MKWGGIGGKSENKVRDEGKGEKMCDRRIRARRARRAKAQLKMIQMAKVNEEGKDGNGGKLMGVTTTKA